MNDKVVKIEFNIWANSDGDADELRKEICAFINYHGQQGRKVTASKLVEALRRWQSNPLVKQSIINHFR